MHATLARRLAQLRSFGAHADPTQRPLFTPAQTLQLQSRRRPLLGYVLAGTVVAVLGPLLGLAFALVMMLDVTFMTIMLLMVWLVSQLVFVTAPHLWHQWHARR
jgi:hypothetical protein